MDRLPVCRILSLQLSPKLGRPRAARSCSSFTTLTHGYIRSEVQQNRPACGPPHKTTPEWKLRAKTTKSRRSKYHRAKKTARQETSTNSFEDRACAVLQKHLWRHNENLFSNTTVPLKIEHNTVRTQRSDTVNTLQRFPRASLRKRLARHRSTEEIVRQLSRQASKHDRYSTLPETRTSYRWGAKEEWKKKQRDRSTANGGFGSVGPASRKSHRIYVYFLFGRVVGSPKHFWSSFDEYNAAKSERTSGTSVDKPAVGRKLRCWAAGVRTTRARAKQ